MWAGRIAAKQEFRLKSVIRRSAAGGALAVAAVSVAFACGFDFPAFLLHDRKETVLGLRPDDWLTADITDLMPRPTDDLKAVEQESVTTESVELADVGEALAPKLAAMRAAESGAAAHAAGEGIPEVARLYVAGAVEFRVAAAALAADASPAPHATAALAYFDRVLALPAEQRAPRATWASYMAGRAVQLGAARVGMATGSAAEVAGGGTAPARLSGAETAAADRAIAYFQQTRELARQGSPDPLGLAVA